MPRVISARHSASASPDELLHQRLATSRRDRLSPRSKAGDFDAELALDGQMRRAERGFIEQERASVANAARAVPSDPNAFLRWFESLLATGAGQNDALFPWLADHADAEQMRWFLTQELANETGFDDLVALTQLKLPEDARIERADGFWQAMQAGVEQGMHRAMLGSLARSATQRDDERIVCESLALGNLMDGLGSERHYGYQSIGARAVVELTTPNRSRFVYAGLERLEMIGAARRYYAFNASLDERHSRAFNREVLRPLVADDPEHATLIAEGALLRLRANARCFERYRGELWAQEQSEPALASFEYADSPEEQALAERRLSPSSRPPPSSSRPVPPSSPLPSNVAPVVRPVHWRDVSSRTHH